MGKKKKQENWNDKNRKKIKTNYSDELTSQIKTALEKLFNNKALANEMPFLFSALQIGSQSQLKYFFENHTDQIWDELKNLLIEEKIIRYIAEEKLQALKEVVASFLTMPLDDDSSSEYKRSSDGEWQSSDSLSGDTGSESSYVIASNRETRLSSGNKPTPEHFIRGNIETYRNEMMGGFINITISNDEGTDLFVSEEAVIKRPTDVTGNIGRIAGDHVISFSFFLKHIESLLKGKEVYEALISLRDWVAKLIITEDDDPYKSIIDEASQYIQDTSRGFLCKHQAFKFLRDKFIPYITATWNQKIGAAFRSAKTNSERGAEGAITKTALKNIFEVHDAKYQDKSIDEFLKVIDYKPIATSHQISSSDNIKDLLAAGCRTNYFHDLTKILSDIIETFFFMYEHDIEYQQRQNVAKMLVSNFLNLNGWVDYYQTNPQDFGENYSLEGLSLESLTDLVLSCVKPKKPILFDALDYFSVSAANSGSDDIDSIQSRENLQVKCSYGYTIDEDYGADQVEIAKKISKKEAKERGDVGPREIQGFDLLDNDGLGNCFYEAVADQLRLHNHNFIQRVPDGTNPHNSLRLAIQGVNFQDRQWADHTIIDRFTATFSDVILAIIDTRNPSAGFISYYMDIDGTVTTNVDNTNLPEDRLIIRIAATGNHFMSVRSHSALENGTIRYEWNAVLPNQEQTSQTETGEYTECVSTLASSNNQSPSRESARDSTDTGLTNNTNHPTHYNNHAVAESVEISLDLTGLNSDQNSE
ncbi:MAG: hypothetical protein N4A31_03545 [Rickettsiales bacterium]|jgi:hypothetical protein|nr:hypothetical protein [Rickettsiales bacterium]